MEKGQHRPTALACEDIETEPVTWDVEEEQERLMREKIGELYNILETNAIRDYVSLASILLIGASLRQYPNRRDKMEDHTIHRVAPYETQLEQYVWSQREKWAWYGFFAGVILTSVAWMIALSL